MCCRSHRFSPSVPLPKPVACACCSPAVRRRIACASFLIMVLGSIFVTWLGYGMWVFMAPIDIYNNGTTVSSVGAPREVFASDDCFQLHKFGFVLEIVGSVYVLLFIVSRCCVGVGFCKAMTLLKPVLS